MARTFDGSDDVIHCSIGALTGRTAAGTFAGIVRRTNDTAFHTIVGLHNSAGTNTLYFQISPTDLLVLGSSGGEATSTLTVLTSSSWVLVAVTKASGSATPRFHRLVYSTNVWTHEAGSGAITDGGSPGAGGTFRTAWQTGDLFQGDIAAIGIWPSALSDSQVEALAYSLAHWHAVAPQAMWVFDQSATMQSVLDWTGGGANQSSLTGTAVATTSVPVLGYGASPVAVSNVITAAPAGRVPQMASQYGGYF